MVQKAVHPLNEASLIPDGRIIFDLDDADFLDSSLTAKIEALCRRADIVIAASRYVAEWCRQYSRDVRVVWTGGPDSRLAVNQKASPAVVAWAIAFPENHQEELAFVRRLLQRVRARGFEFVFRQYGWKEREDLRQHKAELERAGVKVETITYCDYRKYVRSLRDVAIGLQPIDPTFPYGRGKSFGKLLGYMDARAAIVASDAADHTLFFESGRNAIIANSENEWVEAICTLLANEEMRTRLANAAHGDFMARLTSAAAARQLSAVLREAQRDR
jgi:glycosyltransferase involved in cell wall biosynthesis